MQVATRFDAYRRSLLIFLGLVAVWGPHQQLLAGEKPFRRALVLSGGSLRTGAFLGTIAGLKEKGWEPDVILTTCGGSLAGGIAHQTDDVGAWKQYVESAAFYGFLKSITPNPQFDTGDEVAGPLVAKVANQAQVRIFGKASRKIPDFFNVSVVQLPLTTSLDLAQSGFSASAKNRLIVLSGQIGFDEKAVGKPVDGKKLIDPVFFTDTETAKHLKDVTIAAAKNFPNGYISDQVKIITDQKLYSAIRSSMSEPSLVAPMRLDIQGTENFFIAGSIDAYPIELANQLADEVIATAAGNQGPLEEIVFQDSYGFDIYERLKQTQTQPVEHWIDYTDIGVLDDVAGYGPKLNVDSASLKALDFRGLQMKVFMPDTLEDYQNRIQQWWEHGRQRAVESLDTPVNSREHLRDDVLKHVGDITYKKITSNLYDTAHVMQAPLLAAWDLWSLGKDRQSEGQGRNEGREEDRDDDASRWIASVVDKSRQHAPYLAGHVVYAAVLNQVRQVTLDTDYPGQRGPLNPRSPRGFLGLMSEGGMHLSGIQPMITLTRLAYHGTRSCSRGLYNVALVTGRLAMGRVR